MTYLWKALLVAFVGNEAWEILTGVIVLAIVFRSRLLNLIGRALYNLLPRSIRFVFGRVEGEWLDNLFQSSK